MRRPVNMDIVQRQSLVEAAKWVDEEGLSVHGQYLFNMHDVLYKTMDVFFWPSTRTICRIGHATLLWFCGNWRFKVECHVNDYIPFIHTALHLLVQAIPRALAFAQRFNGEAVLGNGRTLAVTSGFTGCLVFAHLLFHFGLPLYAPVRFHVKQAWWDFSQVLFGAITVLCGVNMEHTHIYIYILLFKILLL